MTEMLEKKEEMQETVSMEEFKQLKAAFQAMEKDTQDRILELQLGLRALEILTLSQK